ncbi:hypothetical protein EC988_009008, partial [Linderina pennispora]
MRSFQIKVFTLLGGQSLGGQSGAVEVKELVSSQGRPGLVDADANDPDLQFALRRHPMVLAMMRPKRPKVSSVPTRMKRPSARQSAFRGMSLQIPTHSFVVSTRRQASDRSVRGMDVDKMVETYLPRLYSQSLVAQQVPTPSASPDSALAESEVAHAGIGVEKTQVVPTADADRPTVNKLRATASTMNMRAMFHRPLGEFTEPQIPRLGNRATPRDSIMVSRRAAGRAAAGSVSRRRSEVEELISQANAVLGSGRKISTGSLIRPPRSSLPVGTR